jgi:hypothetical protein
MMSPIFTPPFFFYNIVSIRTLVLTVLNALWHCPWVLQWVVVYGLSLIPPTKMAG